MSNIEQTVLTEMARIKHIKREIKEIKEERDKNLLKIDNDLKKVESFKELVNNGESNKINIHSLEALSFSATPELITLEMVEGLSNGLKKTKEAFQKMYKDKLDAVDKIYKEYQKILKDHNCGIFHDVAKVMVEDFRL
jgi:uncharacterized membrane protein (DUF106 family)